MNKTEYKLFQEISKISVSSDWNDIKKEWKLFEVYESDDPQTCLCGKYPIMEICVLENIKNENIAEVGNSCVNKFLGIESNPVIKGVKKIKNDVSSSVSKKLINKSWEENIINDWEHNFYIDIRLKRSLNHNQEQKKIEINKKILNRYLKK